MESNGSKGKSSIFNLLHGGIGAGLALVVLPGVALFAGIGWINKAPMVGLPILAIFGIMILFGALALISAVFAQLNLSDRDQALALPEGSIRAAIALALIVLFAIISIMLFQSVSEPYKLEKLTAADKDVVMREVANRVLAVLPQVCPPVPAGAASATAVLADPGCPAGETRYTVHLRQPPGQESTDLAKQLLILIGTLMTSVTSFYFASRGAAGDRSEAAPPIDIAGISPNPLPFTPGEGVQLKVFGTGLDRARELQLKQGDQTLKGSRFTSSRTNAECTITAADDTAEGVWTLVVLDEAGRSTSFNGPVTLVRAGAAAPAAPAAPAGA